MWSGARIRKAENACAAGERAFNQGDVTEAEQQFMRALDATERPARKDQAAAVVAARASVGLGRVCLKDDALEVADRHFAKARELAPADQAGFYWAGCTAAHLGELAVAERCFGDALAMGGEYQGRGHVQRAYVRLRQAKYHSALEDLYRAHTSRALDDRARLITALLLLRTGVWDLAATFANSISPSRPAVSSLHPSVSSPRLAAMAAAVSGFAQHQQGQISGALASYQRALDGGFSTDAVLELHAMAAYRHGRHAAAARSWSTLRKRHPGSARFAALAVAARLEHIRGLVRAGRLVEATRLLREGEAGGHEGAIAGFLKQEAARSIADGHNDAARKLLAQCAKLRPDDPGPPHFLALFAALDGKFGQARSLWSGLPANHPHRRLGMAWCAIGQGELDQALADLTGLAEGCDDTRIRHQAAQMAIAVRIRRGDWAALTSEVEGWTTLRAEALYRAGKHQALLALPSTGARRPWQALARLRAWLPGADSTDGLQVHSSGWNDRAQEELGRLLAGAALDRAEATAWTQAVAWLRHSGQAPLAPELIYGLIYGLGGDRTSATSILGRAARHTPDNHRVAHVRALMLLHTLSAADQATPGGTRTISGTGRTISGGGDPWTECIGAWVSVLYSKRFRADWRARAQARYGKPVSADMVTAARTELCALLERRIGAHAADARSLTLLLHREIEAARVSKLHDWHPGGPLHIADLGLHREFSERAVAVGSTEEMRRLFSRAGLAAVRLSAGSAAEAVELALDLRCPRCRRKTADKSQPAMCRPQCPNFDTENPAFAAWPEKYSELAATASSVAAEALLEVAKTAVSAKAPDVKAASISWARAVKFADQTGRGHEVRTAVEKTARGRASTFHRKNEFDVAISILTGATGPLGRDGELRQRVNRDLARLYNARGVTTVNGDRGKADSAWQDFQKALELHPHFTVARLNAGWTLYALAVERSKQANFGGTLEFLRQASEQFNLGLRDKPGDPALTEGLETVMKDVKRMLFSNG